MALRERVLTLVFPARCVNCKQLNSALCAACLATILPIDAPVCSRCGHPLPHLRAACPECRNHPLSINKIESAAWHDGALRQAIHALKYKRRYDIALPLATFLIEKLANTDRAFDLVTSVPLHPLREQERGYNQAELIAQYTARARNIPYVRLLRRTRATADQIGLDGPARRANVADAFAAHSSLVQDKVVLLIDDVATTGATLDACASALFASGANAVFGLTVARPFAQT